MSVRSAHSRDEQILEMYWQEIRENRPLTQLEEQDLFARWRAGDDSALQPLVEANLRFVMRVANDYARVDGPPMAELVAEGNVGLMNAIERFDESKGFKFITYAVWWIRQAIHRCLAEDRRSIRTPMNRLEDFRILEKRVDRLSQESGRDVTFDEAAELAGMGSIRARSALEAAHRDVSLDAPLTPGGDTLLETLLATDLDNDIEDEFEEIQRDDALRKSLDALDSRESTILRVYYGLGAEDPKTLEQIGNDLGLTRERIRQLRNRALTRLRQDHADTLLDWSAN